MLVDFGIECVDLVEEVHQVLMQAQVEDLLRTFIVESRMDFAGEALWLASLGLG